MPEKNVEFPQRAAAIDVGSNAMRCLAADLQPDGGFVPIFADRAAVRLGTDAFGPGSLSPATLDEAVRALCGFRERLDELGVAIYRAVATGAVRQSRNPEALVERAWREAGLRLEVISGEEEARLVWRAVRERVGAGGGPAALMDLGGGSVEVSLIADGQPRWSESAALGSVRLLAEIPSGPEGEGEVRRLLADFTATLRRRLEGAERPARLIATGGNIEALADLVGGAEEENGVRTVPLAAIRELIPRLAALSVAQRMEEFRLPADRADVVLPAAVAYAEVAAVVGVDAFTVPRTGLREGVLLDRVDALRGAARPTRVAFLSDVHANAPALRAALQEAARRGAGRVVMAGDAVGEGPHPLEVTRMLRETGVEAIRGNVDRKALKLSRKKRKKIRQQLEGKSRDQSNRAWTALQLKEAKPDRAWLDALPAEHRFRVGGVEVLVVHGSPRGDTDYLLPSLTPEALATKLEPLEGEARPRVLVAGHSHIPFVREVDGVLVINCGSVGRPKDGDWRGSLVIADFEDGPRAEVIRFEYPLDALLAGLEERQVPGIGAESYRLGVKR